MSSALPQTAAPALDVVAVSHSYGKRSALRDVSLQVLPGQFTALLGINGAGKTTLFNLITRLFDSGAGAISVCGHDIRTAPGRALSQLGVVFQSRALDPSLTVAQNFTYQGALHGIAPREVARRLTELLDRIGMGERAHDKVGRLSGGQIRRVEIARALLHDPKLLLCDEATVGLDVKSRTDIVADVHRLAAEKDVGVLWATHLIDEVWADDPVAILHQGEVLERGPATQVAGTSTLSDRFLELTAERIE